MPMGRSLEHAPHCLGGSGLPQACGEKPAIADGVKPGDCLPPRPWRGIPAGRHHGTRQDGLPHASRGSLPTSLTAHSKQVFPTPWGAPVRQMCRVLCKNAVFTTPVGNLVADKLHLTRQSVFPTHVGVIRSLPGSFPTKKRCADIPPIRRAENICTPSMRNGRR